MVSKVLNAEGWGYENVNEAESQEGKSLMNVRAELTLGVSEARFHLQSSPAVVRKIRVLKDGNCSSRDGNEVRSQM